MSSSIPNTHLLSTFRKSQQNQRIKTSAMDTTLNDTQLQDSPPKKPNIICPTHTADRIYECEICTRLRYVCPFGAARGHDWEREKEKEKERQRERSKGEREKGFGKGIGLIGNTAHFGKDVSKPKTMLDLGKGTLGRKDQRYATPEFLDLGVKFVDSLPYIKNPIDCTDRTGTNPIKSALQQSPIHPQPSQIHIPSPHPIHINHSYTHPAINSYIYPSPTPIRQQIIYMPIIRNVLVPEIVYNPQSTESSAYTSRVRTGHRKKASGFDGDASRFYDGKGVLTPENFKKLAQSIMRT